MPIIHVPEETRKEIKKECSSRPPYRGEGTWDYSSTYYKYRSTYKDGTIWLCPECNTYLHTNNNLWHWTKWYHFGTRKRIRAYEQGLDTEGAVL